MPCRAVLMGLPALTSLHLWLISAAGNYQEGRRGAESGADDPPPLGPRQGQRGAGEAAARPAGVRRRRAHRRPDAQGGPRRGAGVRGHPGAVPADARPHVGPRVLLHVGGRVAGRSGSLLGRRAAGGRLREALRGHRRADVRQPRRRPGRPAEGDGECRAAGGGARRWPPCRERAVHPWRLLSALQKVFCGHEYAVRNLKFALKVEPENEIVKQKLAWAKRRDDEDLPAVPSTLQEEFLYNPFLRVAEEPLRKFTGKTDPVEVLRTLCAEKDNFKKPKERPNPQAMLALEWGLLSPFLEKK
ncbi:hydroxyacylglutathione hydrolase-like protein isoform X1 [Apteryx mantelli]|uniref:Hydroxyacylglutathione hydrolase-like protein isoform X1 n=1 Tax=Apteryx mantelli TaxID=2696672 RepID=A0ABM4FBW8_9AVES